MLAGVGVGGIVGIGDVEEVVVHAGGGVEEDDAGGDAFAGAGEVEETAEEGVKGRGLEREGWAVGNSGRRIGRRRDPGG